jgi:hypothetical protein
MPARLTRRFACPELPRSARLSKSLLPTKRNAEAMSRHAALDPERVAPAALARQKSWPAKSPPTWVHTRNSRQLDNSCSWRDSYVHRDTCRQPHASTQRVKRTDLPPPGADRIPVKRAWGPQAHVGPREHPFRNSRCTSDPSAHAVRAPCGSRDLPSPGAERTRQTGLGAPRPCGRTSRCTADPARPAVHAPCRSRALRFARPAVHAPCGSRASICSSARYISYRHIRRDIVEAAPTDRS